MKRVFIFSAIFLISVGLITTAFVVHSTPVSENKEPKPFYVGVTYCGNTTAEAKLLIDKVKKYTNLFVLQSGSLQRSPDKINEIGDYAVSSGMYFIVYFGAARWMFLSDWLETCEGQWGDRFLGVYYGDELGGKMLEGDTSFWDKDTHYSMMKNSDGSISGVKIAENITVTYRADGRIQLIIDEQFTGPRALINYYPNGTIIVKVTDDTIPPTIVEDYKITYTYEELWSMRPFQTYTETAERFIEQHNSNLVRGPKSQANVTAFTSDYVLYWFDYKAGYDVVLASFGWNHTLAQDIALVRGAAELQNKKWGAIITWKYNHPPYLDSGEAIYDQMRTAYEAGAEYVVIFNYAEDMEGPYGTLQEEHFMALERFWNEVVQNPKVVHGSIKAEAALVLPRNYGWGMRHPEDTIWGLWEPDEESQQIWELLQNTLAEHGLQLDIVYDDSAYPVAEKYPKIYYFSITQQSELFPTLIAATTVIVAIAVVGAALLVYFAKVKKTTGKAE